MKKITLLLLFISLFCMGHAQKTTAKRNTFLPKQKITLAAEINSIVGSYKITRFANKYYDSDTIPNHDSLNAKMARLAIENRVVNGDTLSQEDITEIEKNTNNDTKYVFSFTYEFKANKTYIFSFIDNDKPEETKGTYNYNATTGLITIMFPKKPNIFMKYNKENQTIQNVVKKNEDASTVVVFSKVSNQIN